MIADHETNVVYVADTLERRFPSVHAGVKPILDEHGIPLRIIPGTRDIWCRDYLPIQVSENRFVQFRYAPDYLTGKYRHLRADGEIGPTLPFIVNCERSEIVLDGGNVVGWGDRAIVTDKVFRENAGRSRDVVAEGMRARAGPGGIDRRAHGTRRPDRSRGSGWSAGSASAALLVNDYSTISSALPSSHPRESRPTRTRSGGVALPAPARRTRRDADGGRELDELPASSRPVDRPHVRDEGGRTGTGNPPRGPPGLCRRNRRLPGVGRNGGLDPLCDVAGSTGRKGVIVGPQGVGPGIP